MPGSVIQGKQEIKEFIYSQDDIKTIVDVGPGSGTYPKLLSTFKDYSFIGIEVFAPYIKKFDLKLLYNEIIVSDISELPKEQWPDADCIIFGDVLEHLPKPKAIEVLDRAIAKYRHVVVSIPIGTWPAKIHYGNKKEAHLSTWDMNEIKERAPWEVMHYFTKNSIGVFCK